MDYNSWLCVLYQVSARIIFLKIKVTIYHWPISDLEIRIIFVDYVIKRRLIWSHYISWSISFNINIILWTKMSKNRYFNKDLLYINKSFFSRTNKKIYSRRINLCKIFWYILIFFTIIGLDTMILTINWFINCLRYWGV